MYFNVPWLFMINNLQNSDIIPWLSRFPQPVGTLAGERGVKSKWSPWEMGWVGEKWYPMGRGGFMADYYLSEGAH